MRPGSRHLSPRQTFLRTSQSGSCRTPCRPSPRCFVSASWPRTPLERSGTRFRAAPGLKILIERPWLWSRCSSLRSNCFRAKRYTHQCRCSSWARTCRWGWAAGCEALWRGTLLGAGARHGKFRQRTWNLPDPGPKSAPARGRCSLWRF